MILLVEGGGIIAVDQWVHVISLFILANEELRNVLHRQKMAHLEWSK